MATGPEHYEQAEELLAVAANYEQDGAHATARARVAEAQVNATLALAAATAMSANVEGAEEGMTVHEAVAWHRIAGVKTVKGGAT